MNYDKNSPTTIRTLFNSIAPRYDIVNSILSFRLHLLCNRKLIQKALSREKTEHFLDLCSGTGEIALRASRLSIVQKRNSPTFYLVDFSQEMLTVAQKNVNQLPEPLQNQFNFTIADVTQLPFENSIFDVATCAYGIRNVQNPALCLSEAYRTLKPGGMLVILELTRPRYPILKQLHSCYLRCILPLVGRWMTHNAEAYQYLKKSIHDFVSPDALIEMAEGIGFEKISQEPLTGGIATLFCMHKKL